MKKTVLLLLFVMMGLSSHEREFKVVADGVSVRFKLYSEDIEGTVGGFEASIVFDENDLASSKISGSVDASTLSTKNKSRDKHILSEDYLNVKKFPRIDFESTAIEKNESSFKMLGKLNLIGTEKKISIMFSFNENVFTAKSYIYLKDFGFEDWKKRDDSKLKVFWKIHVE